MKTKYLVSNVVFLDRKTFLVDCVEEWFSFDIESGRCQRHRVNCVYNTKGADGSVAYGLRDGSIVSVHLDTMKTVEWPALELAHPIESLYSVDSSKFLFFRAGVNLVGLISTEDMSVEHVWNLEEEEYCSGVQETFVGTCFLTGVDERVSSVTKLRSVMTGEVLWDFGNFAGTPIRRLDRVVRSRQESDHLHIALCDYKGNEIARSSQGMSPKMVSSSSSGEYYSVTTQDDWSVNSSVSGEKKLGGLETSRIFFPSSGNLMARIFGIGRKEQQLAIHDLSVGGATTPFLVKHLSKMFRNCVFSTDTRTIVLYNTGTKPEYEVIRL